MKYLYYAAVSLHKIFFSCLPSQHGSNISPQKFLRLFQILIA